MRIPEPEVGLARSPGSACDAADTLGRFRHWPILPLNSWVRSCRCVLIELLATKPTTYSDPSTGSERSAETRTSGGPRTSTTRTTPGGRRHRTLPRWAGHERPHRLVSGFHAWRAQQGPGYRRGPYQPVEIVSPPSPAFNQPRGRSPGPVRESRFSERTGVTAHANAPLEAGGECGPRKSRVRSGYRKAPVARDARC